MKWLTTLLKKAQTQTLLPFVDVNPFQFDHLKNTKEPSSDGQYHCYYCNGIIPDPSKPIMIPSGKKNNNQTSFLPDQQEDFTVPKERPWQSSEQTKNQHKLNNPKQHQEVRNLFDNVIQSCLKILNQYSQDHPYSFDISKNLRNVLNSSGFMFDQIFIFGLKPKTVGDLIALLSNSDLQDRAISQKLRSYSNIYGDNYRPMCDACYIENIPNCQKCGKKLYNSDGYYCSECGFKCTYCGKMESKEEMKHDEITDQDYCLYCYDRLLESRAPSLQDLIDNFFAQNPELTTDMFRRAGNEVPMEPDVYIKLFEGLPWNDNYGGKAWADIAKTWKDLIPYQNFENVLSNVNRAMILLDHAFDLTHNTGSLFTKTPDHIKSWLLKALDLKRDLPPASWYARISPEIKKFLKEYHQHKITGPGAREDFDSMERGMGNDNLRARKKGVSQFIKLFDQGLVRYELGPQVDKMIELYDLKPIDFLNTPLDPIAPMLTFSFLKNNTLASRFVMECCSLLTGKSISSSIDGLLAIVNMPPKEVKYIIGAKRFDKLLQELTVRIPLFSNGQKLDEIIKHNLRLHYINQSDVQDIEVWAKEIAATKQNDVDVEFGNKKTASNHGIVKLAELTQNTFFDFYAMTTVVCEQFPRDKQQYCRYMKAWTCHQIIKELIAILQHAVIREARHVDDQLGVNN